MKLCGTEIVPYGLRFAEPLSTARGTFTARRGTLVVIHDEAGRCGCGDAATWPGLGSSAAAVEAALVELPAALEGLRVDDTTEALAEAAAGRLPEVSAALEQALLDLLGQRQQRPLHLLLGDAGQPSVAVHTLVADATAACRAVRDGARALKVKAGALQPDDDLARIAAIRGAVGPAVSLRVDANGAWNVATACRVAGALADLGVDWLEQPVPADQHDSLAIVRQSSSVRIAADEAVDSDAALASLLDAGAVDGVTLKPLRLAGLVATRRLAMRALGAGLRVCVTHTFESIIGRTGALHLAASLPESGAHGLGHPFANDLAELGQQSACSLAVPTAPGLGVRPEPWGLLGSARGEERLHLAVPARPGVPREGVP